METDSERGRDEGEGPCTSLGFVQRKSPCRYLKGLTSEPDNTCLHVIHLILLSSFSFHYPQPTGVIQKPAAGSNWGLTALFTLAALLQSQVMPSISCMQVCFSWPQCCMCVEVLRLSSVKGDYRDKSWQHGFRCTRWMYGSVLWIFCACCESSLWKCYLVKRCI